jgi:hypothetical protein
MTNQDRSDQPGERAVEGTVETDAQQSRFFGSPPLIVVVN